MIYYLEMSIKLYLSNELTKDEKNIVATEIQKRLAEMGEITVKLSPDHFVNIKFDAAKAIKREAES